MNRSISCSIVLLNRWRQANGEAIVDQEAEYPEVAEIVVANCDPNGRLILQHPKVQVLHFGRDPGLRARWIAAALAKSDAILFQNDDLVLPRESVQELLRLLSLDSKRGYSIEGRNPDPSNRYVAKDVKGDVEIILTRAAGVHRPAGRGPEKTFSARERCPREPDRCLGGIMGLDVD